MSDTVLGILALLLFVGLIVGSIVWTSRRSQAIVQRWAEQNGYQINTCEQRMFRRGPFLWRTGRGQTVHHVTVIESSGQMRSGYVRCGSFWGGLLSDKAEVRWDETSDPFRLG